MKLSQVSLQHISGMTHMWHEFGGTCNISSSVNQ